MILQITSDAEADIVEGYWFYEKQLSGLGNHFRTCMIEDMDSRKASIGPCLRETQGSRAANGTADGR